MLRDRSRKCSWSTKRYPSSIKQLKAILSELSRTTRLQLNRFISFSANWTLMIGWSRLRKGRTRKVCRAWLERLRNWSSWGIGDSILRNFLRLNLSSKEKWLKFMEKWNRLWPSRRTNSCLFSNKIVSTREISVRRKTDRSKVKNSCWGLSLTFILLFQLTNTFIASWKNHALKTDKCRLCSVTSWKNCW